MFLLDQNLGEFYVIRLTSRRSNSDDDSSSDQQAVPHNPLIDTANKPPWEGPLTRPIRQPVFFMRSCQLPTFLQLNPDYLLQDDAPHPAEGAVDVSQAGNISHIYLQPQMREYEAVILSPDLDILFLNSDVTPAHTRHLQEWYGDQLDNIKHVMVQEFGQWHHPKSALEVMKPFKHLEAVWVWLDSFRFLPGERMRTKQEYEREAARMEQRDRYVLQDISFSIRYLDDQGNVYGVAHEETMSAQDVTLGT